MTKRKDDRQSMLERYLTCVEVAQEQLGAVERRLGRKLSRAELETALHLFVTMEEMENDEGAT